MQACRADSSRFSARKGSFPTFGASFQPFLAPAGPKGSIESIYVKDFGNTKVANISVATDYCYTTRDGGSVIETTWHYVTAWEGKEIQNLNQLKKGAFLHVIGRLRNRKYTTADGTERIAYDIVASKVELIERPSARV